MSDFLVFYRHSVQNDGYQKVREVKFDTFYVLFYLIFYKLFSPKCGTYLRVALN